MQIALQPVQYPDQSQYANPSIWSHMADALQQSIYRVSSMLISILPGLLAFVLAVAIMTAVGIFLSWVLRRGLTAAKFDDRLAKSQASIADWSPQHSPTALVGRFAFWGCVVLGIVIGISAFDASYSAAATVSIALLPYLTRAVGAALLLFVGNLIARFLARTVLIGAVNNQLQYARFLSMGVKWLVLVLTAAMALDHMQIGGAIVELAFGILFGGIVLTLALAVGLGSRDLVTRSLERNADRSTDRGREWPEGSSFTTPSPRTSNEDPLRHF
jgi:hypothetical protein